MKQPKLRLFLLMTLLLPFCAFSHNATQKTSVVISKSLIKKIHKLKPDTSNSSDIEKMIGFPAACLPANASSEAWVCQWKGNLASSGVINTLNIWFEAGMVTNIIAINASGDYLK